MTTPENPDSPVSERESRNICGCGALVTTTVEVNWPSGRRQYSYCEECAQDVLTYFGCAEIIR